MRVSLCSACAAIVVLIVNATSAGDLVVDRAREAGFLGTARLSVQHAARSDSRREPRRVGKVVVEPLCLIEPDACGKLIPELFALAMHEDAIARIFCRSTTGPARRHIWPLGAGAHSPARPPFSGRLTSMNSDAGWGSSRIARRVGSSSC